MRVAIREQLALLVLFLVLLALCVVSVPTWIYVHNFVIDVESTSLALTASLKSARIASDLQLLQTLSYLISSRVLVQTAFQQFYATGTANWDAAISDLSSALSVGSNTGLLQARLFSRNATGGGHEGLVNVTARNASEVKLPYRSNTSQPVRLGDPGLGYPPDLYPNITYVNLGRNNTIRNDTVAYGAEAFPGVRIVEDGGLLLGPLIINETTALVSISVPIRDNNDTFILGYMTIVSLSDTLVSARDSSEGLGKSGMVLLIGPVTPWNRFRASLPASNSTYKPPSDEFGNVPVHFVLPPKKPQGDPSRHSEHSYPSGRVRAAFPVRDYPAALTSFAEQIDTVNNASSMLKTYNEQGVGVSVGFSRAQTPLVNWTVIVEKSRGEAYQPINTLRDILLGTVFGTVGLIIIIIVPIAHFSVMPVRRLKIATEKSVSPPGFDGSSTSLETDAEDVPAPASPSSLSKKGIIMSISRMIRRRPKAQSPDRDSHRRNFKIPGKVEEGKHFVTDELTELTQTFNYMSDELYKQYVSLDDKVMERTAELNESKKAAEAANESKTLFIANISHELKTPLNGIMGLCAVSMEDSDVSRIKQSLRTMYKSGDLLLHLLEDLLSFSKNQIGHQLKMDEREFRLADIRSQILTIFDKQVNEADIDFTVNFVSHMGTGDDVLSPDQAAHEVRLPALGPLGTGRLKDMCLWGDQHRILQVLINLVSNSLKFTPIGGKVQVRIKCLGEAPTDALEELSRTSSTSKNSRKGRSRNRGGSGSSASTPSKALNKTYSGTGTALSINPMDPSAMPFIQVRESSPSAPPLGAKSFLFEFEVEDSGPGIPEHMQAKVFEPFVQGDLGLSRKYGGTGLGLSICHQLAGLMGGSMDLSSTPGKGTTFAMHIPLKFVKERASSTASSSINSRPHSVEPSENDPRVSTPRSVDKMQSSVLAPQPRLVGLKKPFFAADSSIHHQNGLPVGRHLSHQEGKLRVLVADDNSTNIEVVSRMLKLESVYNVTIAKDGQEAYDLVKAAMDKNEYFDLIFMDVQMPNVDGLQSTRLIREMGYTSPIVALTAFSEESNVKECMDSGMNEFLSKPIRRPALKQVLKKFATIPEEPETNKPGVDAPEETSPTTNQASAGTEGRRVPLGERHDSKMTGDLHEKHEESQELTEKPLAIPEKISERKEWSM